MAKVSRFVRQVGSSAGRGGIQLSGPLLSPVQIAVSDAIARQVRHTFF